LRRRLERGEPRQPRQLRGQRPKCKRGCALEQAAECLERRDRLQVDRNLLAVETQTARMSGWWCTADGAKPGAIELACMLDQFTLDAKLDFADADAFLRSRASRPATCAAEPVTQTTDTRTYVPRLSVR
jgi:hypothetical protein